MSPTRSLLILFAGAIHLFVIGIWVPLATDIGLVVNLGLLGLALLDLAVSPWPRSIQITREVPKVLCVGVKNSVHLHASNRSRRPMTVELHDTVPQPGSAYGLPMRMELEPWKELSGTYQFQPGQRGRFQFGDLYLRYPSRLRLWTLHERRHRPDPIKVYPDIRAVSGFDLLATRNLLDQMGLKLWRLRGRGGEFERLRGYRRGDELRQVDWKATAKVGELISREYTVERNQNILLMLDCGASMRNESEGVSNLERALNAAIILSYIALGQGDNVALLAFSDRIERALAPVRGKPAIQKIIRLCFDLQPSYQTSDYGLAFEEVFRRQRKRALVVFVTHTLDEQHLDTVTRYLRPLASPHLVLCIFLKDTALTELAHRVPESDVEAFHTGAAAELLEAQNRMVARLRESGILVLQTLPSQLTSSLINQYLDLKARHLL